MTKTPAESESDTNLSPQRRAWADKNLDPEARTLLAEDEKYFLRQSVSTPCLNAVAKAEGIWIEDTAGRRYMDFHGNNVHHIGYGHPRLKRAIAPVPGMIVYFQPVQDGTDPIQPQHGIKERFVQGDWG